MWKSVKRFIAVWMICFSTIGCLIIWITEPNRTRGIHSPHISPNFLAQRPFLTSKCTRQLQFWTDTDITPYSDDVFRFHCPRVPCEASIIANTNISTTKVSDGVVFFPGAEWSWDKMHFARPRGQKWIFFSRENPSKISPAVVPLKKYYNNSYDYIMTYRRDSDFAAHFGYFNKTKPEVGADDDRNWAENKTGIVIGPASDDCQQATWKRASFIEELRTFIPIDMYGECGESKPCSDLEGCSEKVRSHKFSLALEDSRCRDFITDRFFSSLAGGTVPIVDGPSRNDYHRIAPPNSFIHAGDYASVQELADYIKLLNSDDHLYNRFFDWKKLGTVAEMQNQDLFKPEHICPIFERMHEDELKEGTGVDSKRRLIDWGTWWLGSCSY